MSDGNGLLAITLGLGGGLLLAYLRRYETGSSPSAPAPASPPSRPSSCMLRIDAKGLTLDGRTIDIAGAVSSCKAAGGADLVLTNDGPASLYVALTQELAFARVPLKVTGERK